MVENTNEGSSERRVVIVDDSRTIQAMLDNAFSQRTDFRVVGFSSDATMAVEMIRRLMPDVVTIDLNMPYIDGATLLRMIDDLKTVCKVIVSDAPLKNMALSATLINAGAALCLGKSELAADPGKFFAKINAAAENLSKGKRNYLSTIGGFTNRNAPPSPANQAKLNRSFPMPVDERQRIEIVRQKGLTNSKRERQFDLVTKHVTRATGFPVSLLTFMDSDTQWIKSASGLDLDSTPREEAFCNYTIAQGGAFVVANAASDERFSDFPSVTDAPSIRCYAGHPVTTSDGVTVGALCVIDNRVRTVSKHVLDQLAGLSEIVAEMINQRPPTSVQST
jgi:DNA-binding NarL/FixJ family response regulator